MKRSSDLWILLSIFLVLLISAILFARQPNTQNLASTSYNPDPKGIKAFYTLLGRLGYSTSRLSSPYYRIDHRARVLVLVEPTKPIDDSEAEALEDWITNGGTLIVVCEDPMMLPPQLLIGGSVGKGYIYASRDRDTITNTGMRNPANAVKMAGIVAEHARHGDLVLFDEYHHGFGGGKRSPAMSNYVKVSLLILIPAALVLAYSRGRRFGAVRQLPDSEDTRPNSDFVESVASLYGRANASDVAIEILCDSFKRSLCAKLGLPSDSAQDTIVRETASYAGPDSSRRVGDILAHCDHTGAGHPPSERELLDVAREIQRLEKELGLGSIAA